MSKKQPDSIKEYIISINDFTIYVIIMNENKGVLKKDLGRLKLLLEDQKESSFLMTFFQGFLS